MAAICGDKARKALMATYSPDQVHQVHQVHQVRKGIPGQEEIKIFKSLNCRCDLDLLAQLDGRTGALLWYPFSSLIVLLQFYICTWDFQLFPRKRS